MSVIETARHDRALWILKSEGYQVFVLSEDNVLLLSERFKRKKHAKAVLEAASDPAVNPAVVLGPAATLIRLSEVSDVRVKSARGYIDLHTDEATHRISGWSSGPVVIGGDKGTGYSMFGVQAIEGASLRIRARRQPGLKVGAAAARPASNQLFEFGTVSDFSYLPPAQMVSFVVQTVFSVLFLATAVAFLVWSPPEISPVLPVVWGLVAGASLIASRPPAALEVDHAGIRWARGRKRVDIAWDAIAGFDVARPADRRVEFRNGLSLFVRAGEPASRSTQEISVGPTHFLSDAKLDHFLVAVRYYRNDLALTSQEIRPAVSSKLVPKFGRKTPVLKNGVEPKSQVGRLAFAIALGFAIPIGLGVLVLVT